MIYDFGNWRANMVLEALQNLDEKWQEIVNSTEDEDVKANYANDMIRLHILQEDLTYKAIEEFGPGIAKFSREPVQVTPVPPEDLPQADESERQA